MNKSTTKGKPTTTTTKKYTKENKIHKIRSQTKFHGSKRGSFFCRRCGQNNTHATPDCWILKRAEENRNIDRNRPADNNKWAVEPFFQRKARKEAHATGRKRAGKNAGAKKQMAECKWDASLTDSSDSSSGEVSVHNMEMDQIGTWNGKFGH